MQKQRTACARVMSNATKGDASYIMSRNNTVSIINVLMKKFAQAPAKSTAEHLLKVEGELRVAARIAQRAQADLVSSVALPQRHFCTYRHTRISKRPR